ncbi:hypothetical protein FKM82_028989, partial [Ascaphus truei]
MSSENELGNSQLARKPTLSEIQAIKLVESLFDLKVSSIKSLPSYDDQNFYIETLSEETTDCTEYVLKVTNSEDSKNEELIEAQTNATMFLCSEGIPTPNPVLTKNGKMMSLESIGHGSLMKKHMVRLLTYVPGTPAAKIVITPNILYGIGKLAAKIDELLTK